MSILTLYYYLNSFNTFNSFNCFYSVDLRLFLPFFFFFFFFFLITPPLYPFLPFLISFSYMYLFLLESFSSYIHFFLIYISFHFNFDKHRCPSGLRGSSQERLLKNAWVRTPPDAFYFFYSYFYSITLVFFSLSYVLLSQFYLTCFLSLLCFLFSPSSLSPPTPPTPLSPLSPLSLFFLFFGLYTTCTSIFLFFLRDFFLSYVDRGCSSDGRAFASHARGKGIDTPHLHFYSIHSLYSFF